MTTATHRYYRIFYVSFLSIAHAPSFGRLSVVDVKADIVFILLVGIQVGVHVIAIAEVVAIVGHVASIASLVEWQRILVSVLGCFFTQSLFARLLPRLSPRSCP